MNHKPTNIKLHKELTYTAIITDETGKECDFEVTIFDGIIQSVRTGWFVRNKPKIKKSEHKAMRNLVIDEALKIAGTINWNEQANDKLDMFAAATRLQEIAKRSKNKSLTIWTHYFNDFIVFTVFERGLDKQITFYTDSTFMTLSELITQCEIWAGIHEINCAHCGKKIIMNSDCDVMNLQDVDVICIDCFNMLNHCPECGELTTQPCICKYEGDGTE